MDSDRDSEERELERLVFGGESEVHNGLQDFLKQEPRKNGLLVADDNLNQGAGTGLEGLDDDDVSR
jgi:hypothetical protein